MIYAHKSHTQKNSQHIHAVQLFEAHTLNRGRAQTPTGFDIRRLVKFVSTVRRGQPIQASAHKDGQLERDPRRHLQPVRLCEERYDVVVPRRGIHQPSGRITDLRPLGGIGRNTKVVRRLGESGQRTFPAKTFPERCYGSDVWYPKCDVLVPRVLPPIPYSSTTSQP